MPRETFTARDETVYDGPVCFDCEHHPCICRDIFPVSNTRMPDGKVYDVNGDLLEDHGRVPILRATHCPHGVPLHDPFDRYDCGQCEAEAMEDLAAAQAAHDATIEYELRFTRNDNSETIIMRGFPAADVIQAARFYSNRPCAVGIYQNNKIVGLARHGTVSVLEEDCPELAAALEEHGGDH